jgi:glycosyltransferase involved in cell wall biosynthesis
MSAPQLSVLMPAYNEAGTIGDVLEALKALDYELEIVVVDDCSSDETAAIVTTLAQGDERITLLRHERNRGKGAAVRTALARSTGAVVIIQDADAEYDPTDIPSLVDLILAGRADAVYGSRLRGGQPQRAHLFWHYAGNRFLSLLTGMLFNTTLSDMEVGYKAIRGDIARGLQLVSDDFCIEPEITARIVSIPDIRIYEVPIAYYGRTFAEGKKITWRDGLRAVWALWRFRLVTWRERPDRTADLATGLSRSSVSPFEADGGELSRRRAARVARRRSH